MDDPVSSLDILPTLLASAGLESDDKLPGTDLIPWLTGLKKDGTPHEELYFWRAGRRAIRMGDYKLTNAQLGNRSELFNIVENYREDPVHQLKDEKLRQILFDKVNQWEQSWEPTITE